MVRLPFAGVGGWGEVYLRREPGSGGRYSAMQTNRNDRDFGWGIAHGAVSRRPPISLYTMVSRTVK
jgi:hypothetical protein